MQDLEHAVAEFLGSWSAIGGLRLFVSTNLLRRVALKDAWSTKNADKYRHKPFEKWRIYRTTGVVFETVAQSGGCFHFDLDIWSA